MAAIVAALVLLGCLGLALLPLLLSPPGGEPEPGAAPGDGRRLLEDARQAALDGIREVDLDLAMGKISAEDHAVLRARLEEEALAAIAGLAELEVGELETAPVGKGGDAAPSSAGGGGGEGA